MKRTEFTDFLRLQLKELLIIWVNDNGLAHSFTDTSVTNGQTYYYAVAAYDKGSDSLVIYPSENAITVSQT